MLTLRRLRRALHASCAPSNAATLARHPSVYASQVSCSVAPYSLRNGVVAARTTSGSSSRCFHACSLAWSADAASTPSTAVAKKTLHKQPKQPKAQMQWNVHRAITVEKTPLPAVLARLRDEIGQRGLSIRVRQAIDVFYFNCAQQVSDLEPAFVAEVVAYFENELLGPAKQRLVEQQEPLSESLNEGVFPAVVRLLLAQGEKQRAWETAQELTKMGSGKLHFRSVGPILEYECREGEFESALAHWRTLKGQEIEWTKTMEDTLVQMVIACQRYHHSSDSGATAASPASERGRQQMQELLRDLRLSTREVSPDNASRLRHAFQPLGFAVKTLQDNKAVTPACCTCRTELHKDGLSDGERRKLIRAIENDVPLKIKNSATTTKEFLVPFKRWLLTKHARATRAGRLHFILDGPNIAYLNQNFDNGCFRFDHVDLVVQMLQREGHEVSITIPYSYLEETSKLYIRTKKAKEMRRRGKVVTRQRTPEDKSTIDRWRDQNLLFSCRTDYLSDDIFWLYASALLGEDGRVVTNDQGRDHVFALLNHRTSGMTTADLRDEHRISMDLLDRWRESSIVNIDIQHGELSPEQMAALEREAATPPRDGNALGASVVIPVEDVRLRHPTLFSRVPQISESGVLHVPIADSKGETTKWLCMQPPPPLATATAATTEDPQPRGV